MEQSKALRKSIFSFLGHYRWLNDFAITTGVFLWNITPKFHYMFHIGLTCYDINPRAGQTYIDESFVGRLSNVYKMCLNGPFHNTVQKVVISKWLAGILAEMAISDLA